MFLFFFNLTPTTWIFTYRHTLSLHYALPIYLHPAHGGGIRRIHRGIVAIGVHEVALRRVDFLACEVLEGVGQAPVAAGLAADPLRTPGIAADRKSTRLNSSH